MAQHPDLPPTLAENIERQRGQLWSRAGDLAQAVPAYQRALNIIVANPSEFSALRRAELEQALAELLVEQGLIEAATRHLAAAEPVYASEYPANHPERLRHRLIGVHLDLRSGQLTQASTAFAVVQTALAGAEPSADTVQFGLLLQAQLALAVTDCAGAASPLAQLRSRDDLRPRRRLPLERVELEFGQACP